MPYDVIIAGLGAMGSQAAWQLARRGRRVLGLDRFAPPHAQGSSHGLSRIIREAYYEGPQYVPLVQRAYHVWAELEAAAGRRLLTPTGGLMIGPPDGELAGGAVRSARAHGLAHEVLSPAEARRRFPGYAVPEGSVAVWEPRAGALAPEDAIAAALAQAAAHGAELRADEPVLAWRADGEGVAVETASGRHRAAALVLAAGAWTAGLLPALGASLAVERNVLYWFTPEADAAARFAVGRFPVFLAEYAPGCVWYGFPDLGDGVKVALHHPAAPEPPADPDAVRREVRDDEVAAVRALVDAFMPGAAGPLARTAVCVYTNTPDRHFVLDRHPGHPQVVVASACSGHGFKFAAAVGEVLADLADGAPAAYDLAPFALARLARQ